MPKEGHAVDPSDLYEVAFGECAPGTRLQVPLELDSAVRVRELDGRDELPGSMDHRMDRPSGVVGLEASGHVGRQADVVARRIDQTSKNVDEAAVQRHDGSRVQAARLRKSPGI